MWTYSNTSCTEKTNYILHSAQVVSHLNSSRLPVTNTVVKIVKERIIIFKNPFSYREGKRKASRRWNDLANLVTSLLIICIYSQPYLLSQYSCMNLKKCRTAFSDTLLIPSILFLYAWRWGTDLQLKTSMMWLVEVYNSFWMEADSRLSNVLSHHIYK